MLLREIANLLLKAVGPYNQLVNWHFKMFVWALEKKIRKIHIYKDLRDPDNPKKKLMGMLASDDTISLSAENNPDEMLQTLIHELCHFFFDPIEDDDEIEKIALILWLLFSDYQKRKLRSYIPKKISGSGAPKKNK